MSTGQKGIECRTGSSAAKHPIRVPIKTGGKAWIGEVFDIEKPGHLSSLIGHFVEMFPVNEKLQVKSINHLIQISDEERKSGTTENILNKSVVKPGDYFEQLAKDSVLKLMERYSLIQFVKETSTDPTLLLLQIIGTGRGACKYGDL